jgi:hypothetical protein
MTISREILAVFQRARRAEPIKILIENHDHRRKARAAGVRPGGLDLRQQLREFIDAFIEDAIPRQSHSPDYHKPALKP